MEDDRLTKKVFLWDKSWNNRGLVSSWTNEIRDIFYFCGLNSVFDNNSSFPLKTTIETIKAKFRVDQAEYLRGKYEQQRL